MEMKKTDISWKLHRYEAYKHVEHVEYECWLQTIKKNYLKKLLHQNCFNKHGVIAILLECV